jgi:hypothetical protein
MNLRKRFGMNLKKTSFRALKIRRWHCSLD